MTRVFFLMIALGILAMSCDTETEDNYISATIDGTFFKVSLPKRSEGQFHLYDDYCSVRGAVLADSQIKEITFYVTGFTGEGVYRTADTIDYTVILFKKGELGENPSYECRDSSGTIQVTHYNGKICKGHFEGNVTNGKDTLRVSNGSFKIESTPYLMPD